MQTLRLILDTHPSYTAETLKYTAPDAQNELLQIMGRMVQRDLLSEIQGRQLYSIMADETSDVSNVEQMCLVLR